MYLYLTNDRFISEFTEEMFSFNPPAIRSWTKDGSLPFMVINMTTNGKYSVDKVP